MGTLHLGCDPPEAKLSTYNVVTPCFGLVWILIRERAQSPIDLFSLNRSRQDSSHSKLNTAPVSVGFYFSICT